MSTAANIVIIILEIIGLGISIKSRKAEVFVYYTQLANMVTLLSSAVFLAAKGSPAAAVLRYLSTVMLVMTFLITVAVLVPQMEDGFRKLMLSGNGLYHHTLCPVISVASYVLWEPHAGVWLLPTALTFVYGLVMLYLNYRKKYDGPYPFFRVYDQSAAATVIWMAALTGLIALISLAVRLAAA